MDHPLSDLLKQWKPGQRSSDWCIQVGGVGQNMVSIWHSPPEAEPEARDCLARSWDPNACITTNIYRPLFSMKKKKKMNESEIKTNLR